MAAQLAAVELMWRHLIERYGAYTSAQIAVMRGADPQNRSVATNLAKTHGLIGFARGGAKLYPAFEFAGVGPHPNWRAVAGPLRQAGWADDDILLWLVSPHPALAGREPGSFVPRAQWATKVLTAVRVTAPLRVAAFHSDGLRRFGLYPADLTDTDLTAYPRTSGWALVAWRAGLAGVAYESHYNTSKAFCLSGDRIPAGSLVAEPEHPDCRMFALPANAEFLAALAAAARIVIRP